MPALNFKIFFLKISLFNVCFSRKNTFKFLFFKNNRVISSNNDLQKVMKHTDIKKVQIVAKMNVCLIGSDNTMDFETMNGITAVIMFTTALIQLLKCTLRFNLS